MTAKIRKRNPTKDQRRIERKLHSEAPTLRIDYPPQQLAILGPIVETDLTIARAHADALAAAGLAIPPAVRCRFLIDTGADGCVVRHEIAERAGLKLISTNVPVHGVGVDTTGRVYIGRVMFVVESRRVAGVQHTSYIETRITSAELATPRFDGLLGRDVLQFFEMRYNGRTGSFELRYLKE